MTEVQRCGGDGHGWEMSRNLAEADGHKATCGAWAALLRGEVEVEVEEEVVEVQVDVLISSEREAGAHE